MYTQLCACPMFLHKMSLQLAMSICSRTCWSCLALWEDPHKGVTLFQQIPGDVTGFESE